MVIASEILPVIRQLDKRSVFLSEILPNILCLNDIAQNPIFTKIPQINPSKVKVRPAPIIIERARKLISAGAYSMWGFCSMKRLGVFLIPHRIIPPRILADCP